MGDAKYLDLIAKYLSGNINEAERKDLLAWVAASEPNKLFFDEMIQLWSISAEYEETFETNVDAAWEKLDQKLGVLEKPTLVVEKEEKQEAKIVRFSAMRWALRAAAILLLFAVGYWWLGGPGMSPTEQMVAFETEIGDRQKIVLPDSSIVWLNENTKFSYGEQFKERTVYLEGEAFFDVKRMEDSPFVILSGDAKTTVLGTSFNVRAYPEEEQVEVTVETGKVKLEEAPATKKKAAEEKKVELVAGKSGFYDKATNEVKVAAEKAPNADAWKTRQLKFSDEQLRSVITVLERYYNIDISTSDAKILNCTLNVNFKIDPSIDEVLDVVSFALNLEVIPLKDGYLLKREGEGCE